MVGYLVTTLLLIVRGMHHCKNFENPLTFGEDIKNKIVPQFFSDSQCISWPEGLCTFCHSAEVHSGP